MMNSDLQRSQAVKILSSNGLACVSEQSSPIETVVLFYWRAGYCLFNLTISEKPPKSSNMSQFKCQHIVGKEANKLNL